MHARRSQLSWCKRIQIKKERKSGKTKQKARSTGGGSAPRPSRSSSLEGRGEGNARKKKRRRGVSDGKDPVPVTSLAEVERGESAEVREALRQQQIVQREEVRGKSQFLALGLHAVTKALEKNKLEVVIVCKARSSALCDLSFASCSSCVDTRMNAFSSPFWQDAEPTRLVQHIPVQAFLTDTPLVVLGGDLSLRLGAIFGIRTVIALGIKVSGHQEMPPLPLVVNITWWSH